MPEGIKPSPEDTGSQIDGSDEESESSPEYGEKEKQAVRHLTEYNLGKPRQGEEGENARIVEQYSDDVFSELVELGAEIPTEVKLSNSDMGVVLITVGDSGRSTDIDELRRVVIATLESRNTTTSASKVEKFAKIALVYGRISVRVAKGWETPKVGVTELVDEAVEQFSFNDYNAVKENPIGFGDIRDFLNSQGLAIPEDWVECSTEVKRAINSIAEQTSQAIPDTRVATSRSKGPEVRAKKV